MHSLEGRERREDLGWQVMRMIGGDLAQGARWLGNAAISAATTAAAATGDAIVNHSWSPIKAADFESTLKQRSRDFSFGTTPYAECYYDEAVRRFREDYEKREDRSLCGLSSIARRIFTQPLWDIPEQIFPNVASDREKELPTLFSSSREEAKQKASEIGQGKLRTVALKVGAKIGLFDPHVNGNFPFWAATFNLCGSFVDVLRHAVPVVETREKGVLIAEEYKAFLDHLADARQKVLYCSLLDPAVGDEKPRILQLLGLAKDPKYQNTFKFLKVPADGFVRHASKNDQNLKAFKERIRANIEELRTLNFDRSFEECNLEGFVPGSCDIRDMICEHYEELLQFSYETIEEIYKDPGDRGIEEYKQWLEEKKQAMMMLFCTMLRLHVLKGTGSEFVNMTCKDAIDRGAQHLTSDLLWMSFLSNTLEEDRYDLKLLFMWPAFMAKSQAVLEDRADWLISFAHFIRKAQGMPGFREKCIEKLKNLGFEFEGKILFTRKDKDIDLFKWLSEVKKSRKNFTIRHSVNLAQQASEEPREKTKRILQFVLERLPQDLKKKTRLDLDFSWSFDENPRFRKKLATECKWVTNIPIYVKTPQGRQIEQMPLFVEVNIKNLENQIEVNGVFNPEVEEREEFEEREAEAKVRGDAFRAEPLDSPVVGREEDPETYDDGGEDGFFDAVGPPRTGEGKKEEPSVLMKPSSSEIVFDIDPEGAEKNRTPPKTSSAWKWIHVAEMIAGVAFLGLAWVYRREIVNACSSIFEEKKVIEPKILNKMGGLDPHVLTQDLNKSTSSPLPTELSQGNETDVPSILTSKEPGNPLNGQMITLEKESVDRQEMTNNSQELSFSSATEVQANAVDSSPIDAAGINLEKERQKTADVFLKSMSESIEKAGISEVLKIVGGASLLSAVAFAAAKSSHYFYPAQQVIGEATVQASLEAPAKVEGVAKTFLQKAALFFKKAMSFVLDWFVSLFSLLFPRKKTDAVV